MLRKLFFCILCVAVLGSCTNGISPEQQAQVQSLRAELDITKQEIAAATSKYVQYSGGAIKALTAMRLEILKTNEALIQQRIQAIESGAKITIQTIATTPDLKSAEKLKAEILKQEQKVSESLKKSDKSSGGLIGAMAQMTAATEINSLAMLRQQYLIAQYGLAPLNLNLNVSNTPSRDAQAPIAPKSHDEAKVDEQLKFQIVTPTLLQKQYAKQDYQDYIWLDIKFDVSGLDKPARAVKGVLIFTDLFDEEKFGLRWTIDKTITPGGSYTEKGSGFEFNQFNDAHKWVRATDVKNMKIKFRITDILYEDGSTRTL